MIETPREKIKSCTAHHSNALLELLGGVNVLCTCSFQYGDLPKARVIVAVSLDGSAKKLITVRSALLLTNLLHCPVDIRLENTPVRYGGMMNYFFKVFEYLVVCI